MHTTLQGIRCTLHIMSLYLLSVIVTKGEPKLLLLCHAALAETLRL